MQKIHINVKRTITENIKKSFTQFKTSKMGMFKINFNKIGPQVLLQNKILCTLPALSIFKFKTKGNYN